MAPKRAPTLGIPVASVTPLARAPVIRFQDVSGQYPGDNRLALRDFSLDVRPGQVVALLGPSGTGSCLRPPPNCALLAGGLGWRPHRRARRGAVLAQAQRRGTAGAGWFDLLQAAATGLAAVAALALCDPTNLPMAALAALAPR
jgi:ABC-type phosphonate transport system ATPase subunit